jgi:hypothetical protein
MKKHENSMEKRNLKGCKNNTKQKRRRRSIKINSLSALQLIAFS